MARATSPFSAATCRRNLRQAGRLPPQASGLFHPMPDFPTGSESCGQTNHGRRSSDRRFFMFNCSEDSDCIGHIGPVPSGRFSAAFSWLGSAEVGAERGRPARAALRLGLRPRGQAVRAPRLRCWPATPIAPLFSSAHPPARSLMLLPGDARLHRPCCSSRSPCLIPFGKVSSPYGQYPTCKPAAQD